VNRFQFLYNSRSEGSIPADFTIVCQDGSEIPVHSFVLSARSDVLQRAVLGDFKEKNEKRIEMKTFSTAAVQEFVRFLYGFELKNEDLQILTDLIEMGGLYSVHDVQTAAFMCLQEHLNIDNIVELMDFVKTNMAEDATDLLCEFVVKNFNQNLLYSHSSDILSNHPEIAVKILKIEEAKRRAKEIMEQGKKRIEIAGRSGYGGGGNSNWGSGGNYGGSSDDWW